MKHHGTFATPPGTLNKSIKIASSSLAKCSFRPHSEKRIGCWWLLPCDCFVIRITWMRLWEQWKCNKSKDFLAQEVFALIPFPQSIRSTKSSVPSKKFAALGLCIPQAHASRPVHSRSQSVHSKIWFSRSGPDLTRQVDLKTPWLVEKCGFVRINEFHMFCRIYFSRPTWSLYNTEHITMALISQCTALWRLDQRIPLALNNVVMSYQLFDVTTHTSMAPE